MGLDVDESNQRYRRAKRPFVSVRVARTTTGRGVFAARRYQACDLIGEIKGKSILDEGYASSYCYDMGGGWCLEPVAPFRFLNHSCTPNCRFEHYTLSGDGSQSGDRRVFVLALFEIAVGEQLTIDYRWPPGMAIRCRCGSNECRGWVVAAEHLEEVLAEQHSRLAIA